MTCKIRQPTKNLKLSKQFFGKPFFQGNIIFLLHQLLRSVFWFFQVDLIPFLLLKLTDRVLCGLPVIFTVADQRRAFRRNNFFFLQNLKINLFYFVKELVLMNLLLCNKIKKYLNNLFQQYLYLVLAFDAPLTFWNHKSNK
jgi:hypothetical protein